MFSRKLGCVPRRPIAFALVSRDEGTFLVFWLLSVVDKKVVDKKKVDSAGLLMEVADNTFGIERTDGATGCTAT
jgi:hypothetical protein